MVGKTGPDEPGCEMRVANGFHAIHREPGPVRDSQASLDVPRPGVTDRHVPGQGDAAIRGRNLAGCPTAVDVGVGDESSGPHVSDLGRKRLGEVVAKEIETDREVGYLNGFRLETRFELVGGKHVPDFADVEREERVPEEGRVLRSRVDWGRLLRERAGR